MSRGYRSVITKVGLITAGVIVAVILIVSFIGFGLSRDAEYERQAYSNARDQAEYTNYKIGKSCTGLAPIDQYECVAKARQKQRANQRDELDLVAQRKSANWAYVMGVAAVVGVGLSVVGVVLVWTTFAETRKANVIANKVLEYETRPVAVFDSFVVQKRTSHFEFVATFKNAGRGPLRIRTVRLIQTRIPRPAGRLGAHKKEVIESGGQVDQTIAVGDVFGPNAGACARYKPGTHDISLVCEVEYDNPLVFPSKPYRTKASCELLPVITRISAINGPIQQMGDGLIVGDISECEIDDLDVANLVISKEMT